MKGRALQILALLFLQCASGVAQTQRTVPVQWNWWVVSTPDFVGPFRGNDAGFKAPVHKEALPKTLAVTQKGRIAGTFEVIVSTAGNAELEKVLSVSSAEVRARAREVLNLWRLEPALLEGKPIRVRLRVVLVEGG